MLVGVLLTLCALLTWFALDQPRLNRELGLTPDGAPMPQFGQFVRALIDAPLTHGCPTLVVLDYDPTTVEGMVTEVNDMTMRVMDENDEAFPCLIVGYVPIDPPAWYDNEIRDDDSGSLVSRHLNIVLPTSDRTH